MTMKTLELTVSFATPAFLGDAEQRGRWRVPPFKALLRHWWRVAVARDCNYDVDALRRRELALFGSAADETGGKSKVRLRLDEWRQGSLDMWAEDKNERFVRINNQVRSDVYLGFGPVAPPSRKKKIHDVHLEHPPAINVNEEKRLRICLTEDAQGEEGYVERALQFAAWFGTLGSRARNGWGSVILQGSTIKTELPQADALGDVLRQWKECLYLEWSHAIGQDGNGPLVWIDKANNWQQAVNKLARLRKELREEAKGFSGPGIKGNVLLGYPLTKYQAKALVKEARIPNQIRFKVIKARDEYRLLVMHLPCAIPGSMWADHTIRAQRWVEEHQQEIWRTVHQVLDERMHRIGGLA